MNREEKVKSWRLLRIDEELRTGNRVNATSIAQKIGGVSSRTIQRDIEYMKLMYNAPIEWDEHNKTYYYSEPNFFVKSIQLTEGELFSVALFDQLLEQYRNTPLKEDLQNIFRKIIQSLPSEITVDSTFLDANTTFIPDQVVSIGSIFVTKSVKFTRTIAYHRKHARKLIPYMIFSRCKYLIRSRLQP